MNNRPLFYFVILACLFSDFAGAEPQIPFSGVYLHPGEFTDGTLTIEEREAQIDEALDAIHDCGFTTVIPYANTTSGKVYWPGTSLPLATTDGWDVLGIITQKARERGLRVMPALCVLSSGHDTPVGILETHPDWALRDGDDKALGWLSPANSEARSWILELTKQLVTHVQPDGIMFDYMRYPNQRDLPHLPQLEYRSERFMIDSRR